MIWLVLRMMMLKRIMKGMRKIGFSCMLANKLGNYPGNRPLITPIIRSQEDILSNIMKTITMVAITMIKEIFMIHMMEISWLI